ncbi:hypothetical protein SAMN05660297_00418 [Natronincola peptidivorans]|uniref:BNR repeat-like domain-containing protein n=1 Tax=Natronincola peptidivorans TaxID=426128 RepID=A0A1H9YW68_9FIRM|nr:hypothetical protein [Natronincola peptidivorans]SES72929.1 hypothetical protein SAMN05660297_00418 [Natronincola peptidivorans]
MGFVTGYEFIVITSKNQIYNFYLNEKQQLEYITTDESRRWAEKSIVSQEKVNSFSIEIDPMDKIHILTYTKKGALYYHFLSNDQWMHEIIKDYSPDNFIVYYPVIKRFDQDIHFFYYLQSKKKKNICDLVHLIQDGDKFKEILSINATYDKYMNPFHIFDGKENLYLLYTSIEENYSQLFLNTYDKINSKWEKSIQITHSPIDKVYLYGLFINDADFHISWSEHDEKGLIVKYMCSHKNKLKETTTVLSLSEKLNCSFPILINYKNILWCVWTQMNKLYSCYSIDEGESWSMPTLRHESQGIGFKLYGYRSNTDSIENSIHCNYLFGSLYPKIQFLGFGGEKYDEI